MTNYCKYHIVNPIGAYYNKPTYQQDAMEAALWEVQEHVNEKKLQDTE
jgi:hypothetical protein